MSNTADPELRSVLTNACKPSKDFDFPGIMQPFSLVWFEECQRLFYSRWKDNTCCLPCVLFGYKNVGKSLQ